MAALKELCASIPSELLRLQTDFNYATRRIESAEKNRGKRRTMPRLEHGRCVFEMCRQHKPTRPKWHNHASRDAAGTPKNGIVTMRTAGSYRVSVCRTKVFSL